MRYLVHKGNSTYDVASKRFFFNLDRRFPNPTTVKLSKANFIASTADTYPTVVYLRSAAIDDLVKLKHTVELTDEAHENPSDTLMVLEETHDVARYRAAGAVTFPVHGHKATSKIDFYFTDNRTVLNGVYTPTEVPGTSDEDMDSFVSAGSVIVWIDMSKDGNVLNNSQVQASEGESVSKIISRAPGGTLQLTGAPNKVKFTSLGEGKAVTKQTGGTWSYLVGSATGLNDLATGSHFFLFKSPSDSTGLEVVWQSGGLHLFVWGDQIQYKNSADAYEQTGLVVLDNTDYLLQVAYDSTESNFYLTKLSDESEQSALNQEPIQNPDGTARYISTAQSHMNGTFGDYVHCKPSVAAAVKTYMLQRYSGAATVPVVDPNGKDASFFLQLDIDAK